MQQRLHLSWSNTRNRYYCFCWNNSVEKQNKYWAAQTDIIPFKCNNLYIKIGFYGFLPFIMNWVWIIARLLLQTCRPWGRRKSGRRWDRGSVTFRKTKLWLQSTTRCRWSGFKFHISRLRLNCDAMFAGFSFGAERFLFVTDAFLPGSAVCRCSLF